MKKIETLKQVQALIGETYMYAAIIAIGALILAFIIANIIKYSGGKNSNDHYKRRVWFIVIGIFTPISFFLYNVLYVSSYIAKAPLQALFSKANIWSTFEVLFIYIVLGVLTMLIMRRSKWGSILGK